MEPIRIAAAVILDQSGQTLLVRKRGTTSFMQAGGKLEEIRWVDPRAIPPIRLAPLTRDHLLPTLAE